MESSGFSEDGPPTILSPAATTGFPAKPEGSASTTATFERPDRRHASRRRAPSRRGEERPAACAWRHRQPPPKTARSARPRARENGSGRPANVTGAQPAFAMPGRRRNARRRPASGAFRSRVRRPASPRPAFRPNARAGASTVAEQSRNPRTWFDLLSGHAPATRRDRRPSTAGGARERLLRLRVHTNPRKPIFRPRSIWEKHGVSPMIHPARQRSRGEPATTPLLLQSMVEKGAARSPWAISNTSSA